MNAGLVATGPHQALAGSTDNLAGSERFGGFSAVGTGRSGDVVPERHHHRPGSVQCQESPMRARSRTGVAERNVPIAALHTHSPLGTGSSPESSERRTLRRWRRGIPCEAIRRWRTREHSSRSTSPGANVTPSKPSVPSPRRAVWTVTLSAYASTFPRASVIVTCRYTRARCAPGAISCLPFHRKLL